MSTHPITDHLDVAAGRAVVPWFVDVTHGFMDTPDVLPPAQGGLYVRDLGDASDPGATLIRERLPQLRDWAEAVAPVIVYQGDVHRWGDPEIVRESPRPELGTYHMHCEEGTRAAELIPEIAPRRELLVLSRDARPGDGVRMAREAVERHAAVFIEKSMFDVFAGNAATDALEAELHRLLGGPLYVGSGVAADVCVQQWVDGMLARGRDAAIVADAVHGLGFRPLDDILADWRARGVALTTVRQLTEPATA